MKKFFRMLSGDSASSSVVTTYKEQVSPQQNQEFLEAVRQNKSAHVRLLLECNPHLVNVHSLDHWSALHWFAREDNLEMVNYLMSKGGDLDLKTIDGKTVLDVATGTVLEELRRRKTEQDPLPVATVALLRSVASKRSDVEIEDAVRRGGRDVDLAMELLLSEPPNLHRDPEKWFRHFDLCGDNLMHEKELVVALRLTLGPEVNQGYLARQIRKKWNTFDRDDCGGLTYNQFVEPDGARDFILDRWGSRFQSDGISEGEEDEAEEEDEKDGSTAGVPLSGTSDDTTKQEATEQLNAALSRLQDDGMLGVYFAVHSLHSEFDDVFRTRYRTFKEKSIHFQVLFVSMDADKIAFDAHDKMDWNVVPCSMHAVRKEFANRFKVPAFPWLVLLAKNGAVAVEDARRVIRADTLGEGFPWAVRPPSESSTGDSEQMRLAVQTLMGRALIKDGTDDVSMARTAARAPLTEEGYQKVAGFKSNYAMKRFAQRVIATKQWIVMDDLKLTSLVWEHSGVRRIQTLERLLRDLQRAQWIVDADIEEGRPLPTETFCEMPESDAEQLTRTQLFRHAFASSKTQTVAVSLQPPPSDVARVAGDAAEGAASSPAGEGQAGPAAEEKATSPLSGQGPAGPAGKGRGKGPGKGAGKGVGKEPAPKGQVLPEPIVAVEVEPIDGSSAPTACKGPAPKGAGKKGEPPVSPGAPKGALPAAVGGKGAPGTVKGGRGAPKGALPSAVGGKGAPGAFKGGKGPQPTRAEVLDWKDKKTNPLRWKRVVQDEGVFDDSLFAGVDKEEVAVGALQEHFVKMVEAKAVVVPEKTVTKKPVVWEPTEKKTPEQRRQQVAIQMKAWNADAAERFLERLQQCQLLEIRNDPDFREDRFEQLAQLIAEMSVSGGPDGQKVGGIEWTRIGEIGAEERYEWDRSVEGFLSRLQNLHNFRSRVEALTLQMQVERELDTIISCAGNLQQGMDCILQAKVVRTIFLKILSIGNCLNAGETKFNRADGFDVIQLLEASDFLQSYKGPEGVSLLRHLQSDELTDDDFESLEQLAQATQHITWRPSKEKEEEGTDPTDLGELRRRAGDIARALGQVEQWLDSEQQLLSAAPNIGNTEIQEFSALIALNRQRNMKLETDLDTTEETLAKFNGFLAHQPPKKKELVVGRSLGMVAFFVRKLVENRNSAATNRRAPRRSNAAGNMAAQSAAVAMAKRNTTPGNI